MKGDLWGNDYFIPFTNVEIFTVEGLPSPPTHSCYIIKCLVHKVLVIFLGKSPQLTFSNSRKQGPFWGNFQKRLSCKNPKLLVERNCGHPRSFVFHRNVAYCSGSSIWESGSVQDASTPNWNVCGLCPSDELS